MFQRISTGMSGALTEQVVTHFINNLSPWRLLNRLLKCPEILSQWCKKMFLLSVNTNEVTTYENANDCVLYRPMCIVNIISRFKIPFANDINTYVKELVMRSYRIMSQTNS